MEREVPGMVYLVMLVDYKSEVCFWFFLFFSGFCVQVSPNFCGWCPSPPFEGKEDDEHVCVGTLSFACCEKKAWLAKLERSNKDSSARYIAFSVSRQLELDHSFCHFFNLLEEAKGVSNPLAFSSLHHFII